MQNVCFIIVCNKTLSRKPIFNHVFLWLKPHVKCMGDILHAFTVLLRKGTLEKGTDTNHWDAPYFNLVIPFDDKQAPEDLNACKGDKASASLNSKIEAVNLRSNINLFEASVSVLSLCEIQDRCVYLS